MKYGFEVYQAKDGDRLYWIAQSEAYLKHHGDSRCCYGEGNTIEDAIEALETKEPEWLQKAEFCGYKIFTSKPKAVVSKDSLMMNTLVSFTFLIFFFVAAIFLNVLNGRPSFITIFSSIAVMWVTLAMLRGVKVGYTSLGYTTPLEKYFEKY